METKQRAKLETAVYGKTHRDYKGKIDGVRTILIGRPGLGTCLVSLSDLTVAELVDKARACKVLPCPGCGEKGRHDERTAEGGRLALRCAACGSEWDAHA